MAKVSITIDDTNPAIVAAFGADSLSNIADALGYPAIVAKEQSELPAQVERPLTEEEIASGAFMEGVTTVTEYPEGTTFDKPNPQPKGEFLGQLILKKDILPRLLSNYTKNRKAEAEAAVKEAIAQAEMVLESAAVITTE